MLWLFASFLEFVICVDNHKNPTSLILILTVIPHFVFMLLQILSLVCPHKY